MVYILYLLGINNLNVIHAWALINNSYNKTNKSTNLKKKNIFHTENIILTPVHLLDLLYEFNIMYYNITAY